MRKTIPFFIAIVTIMLSAAGAHAQIGPGAGTVREDYRAADYSAPKKYVVNSVVVTGLEHIDPRSMGLTGGITVGDTVDIPGNYVSLAIKEIMARNFFSDVQIFAAFPGGDKVDFEVVVKERPRVMNWYVTGISRGQKKEIEENLKFQTASQYSEYIVDKHVSYIKQVLAKKGFRNARVRVITVENPEMDNTINVTYDVTRGHRVKIGRIDFTGNEVLSDRRLRRAMAKTHRTGINIFRNAKFDETDYRADQDKIIDLYNSRGYRSVHIVSDTVYNESEDRLGIRMAIEEGNKFYFRNIEWLGNSIHSTEELQGLLGFKRGDVYDRRTLYKRLGLGAEDNPDDPSTIKSLYANDGYLMFSIDPAEQVAGVDSVDLQIKLWEGPQATVNNVTISGNHRLDDEVIRREIQLRPGDLYNRQLLMITIRQLQQMEHFSPTGIMPVPQPSSASGDRVDIAWPLEEMPGDKLDVSGGWGGGMFVGTVGVQLNNVSIKRMFKKDAWRPYPGGQGQSVQIKGQSNGQYYKALMLGFTEPWLGGRKPRSLNVSGHYSSETDSYSIFQSGSRHFRTFSLSVGLGRRLSWPDPMFELYNEISYQAYNLKDWSSFIVQNGTSNTVTLRTVFGRNSLDSPIFPRSGSNFSVSLALTPPYSLFDKKDYSDPGLSNKARYGWIEYHKWLLKGQWFTPMSQDGKWILMAKAEMGYLGHYNKHKPSPFEGFDIGGSGMVGYNVYGVDVVGMRGYEEGVLTPVVGYSDFARVYNKYTLELRYPLVMEPATQMFGLIFAEGGNGYRGWEEFNPFQIKRSVGLGIRMNLQIVGMIGFDWGFGFDNAYGENNRSGGHVSFTFGQSF